MRITNKMMTNNSLSNINNNKYRLSKLEEQYSTQKKIQRPSDDPIIAVRALKLRSNLDELNQYYEKNIPDARAWMDLTEGALTKVNGVLTSIYGYCNQGATDTLTKQDRVSVIESMMELKEQIYQEGNSNYAGRYVFTGYKTDTSLLFNEDTSSEYTITEEFTGADLEINPTVIDSHKLSEYDAAAVTPNTFADSTNLTDVYRLRLSYEDLDEDAGDLSSFTYTTTVAGVDTVNTVPAASIIVKAEGAADAYKPVPGTMNYIPETGEIIMAKDVYDAIRVATNIEVKYNKTEFAEGDLRPEHYFDCEAGGIQYTTSQQSIEYEINFNQKLKINTEGKDSITHAIGRDIDEIQAAVQAVEDVETKIAEVEKLLTDDANTAIQTASLTNLKEQFEIELSLKSKVMQQKFENGMTAMTGHQDVLNIAIADIGSRAVRLDLTEDRLSDQQVQFEDLLSTNEDADLAETLIRYNSQEQVYNASLSAAAKVIKNTLLDFL